MKQLAVDSKKKFFLGGNFLADGRCWSIVGTDNNGHHRTLQQHEREERQQEETDNGGLRRFEFLFTGKKKIVEACGQSFFFSIDLAGG